VGWRSLEAHNRNLDRMPIAVVAYVKLKLMDTAGTTTRTRRRMSLPAHLFEFMTPSPTEPNALTIRMAVKASDLQVALDRNGWKLTFLHPPRSIRRMLSPSCRTARAPSRSHTRSTLGRAGTRADQPLVQILDRIWCGSDLGSGTSSSSSPAEPSGGRTTGFCCLCQSVCGTL
jgi:hypothetical protein